MKDTASVGASGSHNKHARLAPSSAKRWTTCTASPQFETDNADKVPADTGSIYAQEGTRAHDYAEQVLRGTIAIEEVPTSGDAEFPDADFRTPVKVYTDYCLSVVPEGDTPYIEAQVPLFYSKDDTGTCDFGVITDDFIEIVDYKHGAGVFVEVVDNEQLAIYAMSFIEEAEDDGIYEFEPDMEIRITLAQPRHHAGDPIRTWTLTLNDLRAFCEEIRNTAAGILNGDEGDFAPSEGACRWCNCKAFCGARAESLASPFEQGVDALTGFDDLTAKEQKSIEVEDRLAARCGEALTHEQMVALYARTKQFTLFLSDIAEYLAANVDDIDGVKMVMGREGNRAWINEEAADSTISRKLKADVRYTRKLISPTQAEKLLKEELKGTRFLNAFNDHIGRAPAKPVLALESDKRPGVTSSTEDFNDLTESDGLD